MGRGSWALLAGLAVLILAVGVGLVIAMRPPEIPPSAASQPVSRAELTGPVTPDATDAPVPTGDVEPGDVDPSSPAGAGCLDDLRWGDGWAYLCWAGSRYLAETDPEKDYYVLKFHGSFERLRWLVIRAQLVHAPGNGVFEGWPESTIAGECRQEPVIVSGLPGPLHDDVCGRTEGSTDFSTWTHSVTWTCEQCILPDASTRAITLYNFVGIPEGTRPVWDLFADAGT